MGLLTPHLIQLVQQLVVLVVEVTAQGRLAHLVKVLLVAMVGITLRLLLILVAGAVVLVL
jgi:hypothetical protein